MGRCDVGRLAARHLDDPVEATLSTVPNAWPAWARILLGVLAAVAMGLTVGVLTGRTLERLIGA